MNSKSKIGFKDNLKCSKASSTGVQDTPFGEIAEPLWDCFVIITLQFSK